MTEEEQYRKELAESGVDVPELKEGETPEQKAITEAKAKEEADAKAKADVDAKAKADAIAAGKEGEDDKSKTPAEDKKRSIYDDYKDKKKEAKDAEARAVQAEKERDEFKALLENSKKAKTPEEKKDALDEFDEFAKEIEADPEKLRKMRDLILKGAKLPESVLKDLEDLKAWKAERAEDDKARVMENAKKQFEDEFTTTLPALKVLFPKATDDEMKAIKTELDKISHSTGWNDKDLEYIAFKHQKQLAVLVSPKKRGMEGTNRVDESAEDTSEFDPNADYSKMSPAQKEKWEKQYGELTKKPDGLATSSSGKKSFI